MRPAERLGRLLVVAAWMALVSYWSGQGTLPIDRPEVAFALRGLQHRLAHLVAFGLLGLLGYWAFEGWPRRALLAVLLTSAFGALDEYHQSFTPGRRAAWDDWLADTLFAALAVFLWLRVAAPLWVRGRLRLIVPLALGTVVAVGLGLAILLQPGAARPPLRTAGAQVSQEAVGLARSTRDATWLVARQLRDGVRG
jgi:VanZ family protein